MFVAVKDGVLMLSALRKTLMLFWILTLGIFAALRYLITTKLLAKRRDPAPRAT
jgi:hypothetical protein